MRLYVASPRSSVVTTIVGCPGAVIVIVAPWTGRPVLSSTEKETVRAFTGWVVVVVVVPAGWVVVVVPGTVVVDPGTVVVVVVVVGDPIGCICAVSDMFGLGYPEGMFTDERVQASYPLAVTVRSYASGVSPGAVGTAGGGVSPRGEGLVGGGVPPGIGDPLVGADAAGRDDRLHPHRVGLTAGGG